ncbi:MAG: hypothetical protein WA133_10730, partial [Syntrophales bacterium]
IFAYIKTPIHTGLVQLQDKIVDRCALTIYPYSFDWAKRIFENKRKNMMTKTDALTKLRFIISPFS